MAGSDSYNNGYEENGAKGDSSSATRRRGGKGKDSSVIYRSGEMPKLRGGGIAKKLALYISAKIKSKPEDGKNKVRDGYMADPNEAPDWRPVGDYYIDGDVEIAYGYEIIQNKEHSARSYKAPIKDFKGKVKGHATVVLSERLIDERKGSLALTVILLLAFFVLVGIGISVYVGRKITEPIKCLIKDVTIVAGGDLSHHTVPQSPDEIGLLARTFDKMTQNLNDAKSRELDMAAQQHQMMVAQEVQSNLLPAKIPALEGYEILPYHRSSKEVDGNYYDAILYPNGTVGVMVAAASGKGVPAAMVMTMARSFFRSLVSRNLDPEEMMKEANRLLSPDLRSGMYVEVLMAIIDSSTNKIKIISAGPTSLLRYNAAENKLNLIHAEGIALGFDKGPIFDRSLKEVEFSIEPGDRLVLNTPGLLAIKNPAGKELSIKGLGNLVKKFATLDSKSFINRVVQSLDSYAGKDIDETDLTLITVRRIAD